MALLLELERQRHSKQACLKTPQLFGQRQVPCSDLESQWNA